MAHRINPGVVAGALQHRNSAVHKTFLLQLVLHGKVGRQPLGGGKGIRDRRQEAIFLADEHPVRGQKFVHTRIIVTAEGLVGAQNAKQFGKRKGFLLLVVETEPGDHRGGDEGCRG